MEWVKSVQAKAKVMVENFKEVKDNFLLDVKNIEIPTVGAR